MHDKLFNVISVLIGIPVEDLSEDSSYGSVPYWDSLKHMNLILALEEEFDVSFTDEEISRISSIRDMIEILKNRGVHIENL
ncbi:MAG: acyl carrier protein [Candidatus Hodarchaeota archaeon]